MLFKANYKHDEYLSLPSEDAILETSIAPHHRDSQRVKWHRFCFVISYILVALFAAALGLAAGHFAAIAIFHDDYPQPAGNTHQVWHQNDTFTGPPSATTEQAWEAPIPLGKGFVTHPRLAPENHAVAAFHQIHCLHGIRIAYYRRLDTLNRLQNPLLANRFLDTMGADTHAHHVDHCFEYLRQALMCAADSNLEDVDETGEATGWGNRRTCRNYEGLMEWSAKWKTTSEDKGFI